MFKIKGTTKVVPFLCYEFLVINNVILNLYMYKLKEKIYILQKLIDIYNMRYYNDVHKEMKNRKESVQNIHQNSHNKKK